MIEKVKQAVAAFLAKNPSKSSKDVTIACFGLSFKADIDDLRESPAVEIVKELATLHNGPVIAVEPNITRLPGALERVIDLKTVDEALAELDIAVLLVDHKAFKKLDRESVSRYELVDTRGIWR